VLNGDWSQLKILGRTNGTAPGVNGRLYPNSRFKKIHDSQQFADESTLLIDGQPVVSTTAKKVMPAPRPANCGFQGGLLIGRRNGAIDNVKTQALK
jgi:hypothetical protein